MTESWLYRLTLRLRPAIASRPDETQRLYGFLEVLPLIFTLPYVFPALIGLVLFTDLEKVSAHPLLFVLVGAALYVMERHQFQVWLEARSGEIIPITGTLTALPLWSAALIFGPVVLWLSLLSTLLRAIELAWQSIRLKIPARWTFFSFLSQEIAGGTLSFLGGLLAYEAAGGTYPLTGLALSDWGPAVLGGLVELILVQIVLVPLLVQVNRFMPFNSLLPTWAGLVVFSIIMSPFGIMLALIFSEAGTGLFVVAGSGVVLVNYLIHFLSRTNERSRQRAREMEHLEALGETLIQAPPDLSTLGSALQEHVELMFPQDRFELRLIPSTHASGLIWPDYRFTNPHDRQTVDDSVWEQLWQASEPYLNLHHVIPPHARGIYGDAIMVRIEADDPGQEGGPKEQVLGGLCLLRNRTIGKAAHSRAALQSLASQIGAAHYRAQAYRETLAKQRMAQELELAGRIQASFLPNHLPDIPGWDIAAGLLPARQTSGDFYDLIELDGGRLGIVVADVADKGTGAALYMALSRTLIRTFALQYPDAPEEVLCAANERLLTDAVSDLFVTVFYGVLDPGTATLTYANGGHNPGYALRAGLADPVVTLEKTGIPLGMFAPMTWTRAAVTLGPADRLMLYSDGVTEAQNPAAEEYGIPRLLETAAAQPDCSAQELYDMLIDSIRVFTGSAAQFDDITLLVAVQK